LLNQTFFQAIVHLEAKHLPSLGDSRLEHICALTSISIGKYTISDKKIEPAVVSAPKTTCDGRKIGSYFPLYLARFQLYLEKSGHKHRQVESLLSVRESKCRLYNNSIEHLSRKYSHCSSKVGTFRAVFVFTASPFSRLA